MVHELRVACESGDATALAPLLAPDVCALVDTAGDVIAPTRPLRGPAEVAAALVELCAGASLVEHRVNGAPALVARRGTHVVGVVSVELRARTIWRLWVTRSPQKLQRWNT